MRDALSVFGRKEMGALGVTSVKNALYFSADAFSSKVLIGDTIFTFPIGEGTTISRGHPSHAKV